MGHYYSGGDKEKPLVTLNLSQLIRSPDFQVRMKIDKPTVARYVAKLKSGEDMPPVAVAQVGEEFILLDGFHRVEAREEIGEGTIVAEVVTTTKREARAFAALANLKHGKQVTNKELRNAFKMYIEARQHIKKDRSLKSYREIGKELGKPHNTIRNWMKKDFPKIFKRYTGDDGFRGDGGLYGDEDQTPEEAREGLQKLEEFRQVYQKTVDADARSCMRNELNSLGIKLLKGDAEMWLEEDF